MCQEESFVVASTITAAVYALYLPERSQARYVMAWICFPFHIFSGFLLPLWRTFVMRYAADNLPESWAFTKMVIGVIQLLRFRFLSSLFARSL